MVWKAKVAKAAEQLDLFFSVFLSAILTLISLGFFLRIGFILGTTNLFTTYLIISLGVLVCTITAFSISSMVSNVKLEGRSLYYLLSRTFGLDVAFAISLPLFISQALSVCFYLIGSAEVISLSLPLLPISWIYLFLFILLITFTYFFSSQLVKTEAILFVFLCLMLFSFYIKQGGHLAPRLQTLDLSPSFWAAFALFFPSLTGIEGILTATKTSKIPPRLFSCAVFSALLISLLFFLSITHLLDAKIAPERLISQPAVIKALSLFPAFTVMTLLGLGLVAAVSALMLASSTWQGMAEDNLVPRFFKKTSLSLLFTLSFVSLGLFQRNLDQIAPLLTLFFLISYGMLNMATGLESWIENPSWRPTIKAHFSFPLLGALLCFIIIMMISPGFGIISFFLIFFLYLIIKKKGLSTSWEDFRYSLLLFFSRSMIYKLNRMTPSAKTWRPNLLVFIGDPFLKIHLSELSCDLTHKKGFLIFSSLLTTDARSSSFAYEGKKIDLLLKKKDIPALIKTKQCDDISLGMQSIIEDMGLGALSPNTIVLGASEQENKALFFAELILFIHKNKKNLILVREGSFSFLRDPSKKEQIDVWWGGKNKQNSELMIILSYMLKKSKSWSNAVLNLKTSVHKEEDIEEAKVSALQFKELTRMDIETEIVLHTHGRFFETTLLESSKNADLIFLGLRVPEEGESATSYSEYYLEFMRKTKDLPPIAYVLKGEDLNFRNILFQS